MLVLVVQNFKFLIRCKKSIYVIVLCIEQDFMSAFDSIALGKTTEKREKSKLKAIVDFSTRDFQFQNMKLGL